jgi:hypothetical protein
MPNTEPIMNQLIRRRDKRLMLIGRAMGPMVTDGTGDMINGVRCIFMQPFGG